MLSPCDALESQLQSTESTSTQLLSIADSHGLMATNSLKTAITANGHSVAPETPANRSQPPNPPPVARCLRSPPRSTRFVNLAVFV